MAYDSTNRKLYTTASQGISTSEVAACLNDHRVTRLGRSIGLLCTSPKINPMARYKPEDYNTFGKLTETQRAENHYGFGKQTPYFTAGGSVAPHAAYQYVRPKGGGTSPCRILDFDGYNHRAVSPLHIDFPAKLYVDWANGVSIIANSSSKERYDSESCVKLGEAMGASNDMYVALFVFKDSTHQWLLPTDVKVNELSESVFPTVVFAGSESDMASASGRVYPYILSDIATSEGDTYTLIAVGVEGLSYQTDKIPLSVGGSGDKAIGNRSLFSMELEDDADRVVLSAAVAKQLDGLTGSFTPNFGTFKSWGSMDGYPAYKLSSADSTLVLNTPNDWFFTSQDKQYVEVTVNNTIGVIYNASGTNVGTLTIGRQVSLSEENTAYSYTDLMASLTNYYFTDMSGTSWITYIGLQITIRVYRSETNRQDYVEIYNRTINISKQ